MATPIDDSSDQHSMNGKCLYPKPGYTQRLKTLAWNSYAFDRPGSNLLEEGNHHVRI